MMGLQPLPQSMQATCNALQASIDLQEMTRRHYLMSDVHNLRAALRH